MQSELDSLAKEPQDTTNTTEQDNDPDKLAEDGPGCSNPVKPNRAIGPRLFADETQDTENTAEEQDEPNEQADDGSYGSSFANHAIGNRRFANDMEGHDRQC